MSSLPHYADLENILSRLTLEEKVSLTSAASWWRTDLIQRNGEILVPHIKTTDGPNGARGESYVSGIKSACFPCSTCIGASFDEKMAFQIGREIAKEAKSKSADVLLAPTVNNIRSPLGGRNHETYSEDPHLLGVMGAAYINGCQSEGIGATAKHFVANDIEKRRRFLTAEIDERTLREIYLYPFQIILKKSDPWCFMTSYNRVNGVYCASDPRLLTDILRKEWGFKGLVMSDWVGTYSTVQAINAGLDLEMPGPTKFRGGLLVDAVKGGKVSGAIIDESAMRVLQLIEKSGRFEHPYDKDEVYINDHERDEIIMQAAAEATVLLKNERDVLPLKPSTKIVVIGQHASIPTVGGGGSAKVDSARSISPLTGLKEAGVLFEYEPGVPVFGAIPLPDSQTVTSTDSIGSLTDSGRPVRVEWFNGSTIGQNVCHEQFLDKTEYMIKERWPSYLDADYCTRLTFNYTPKASGNHLLSVLTTGTATLFIDDKEVFYRPQEQQLQREAFYFYRSKFERRFTFRMESSRTYAIRLESWATEPEALARTIGGAVIQGSGVRFFEEVNVPAQIRSAAAAATTSDVALIFTGTTNEFESEGYDRESLDLTAEQYNLIEAVTAVNPNTVIANYSGSPVNMAPFVDRVAGIVQCWFPGQEAGHSVARVLTGKTNPCGKLPMSWPRDIEDNASFPNWPTRDDDVIVYEEGIIGGYKHYDRPGAKPALFSFGFGLSYSTFVVTGLASTGEFKDHSSQVKVVTTVENTSILDGKTVLQFYVQAPQDGPIQRAFKDLKAFSKVLVKAKSTETVEVMLDKYAVSFYDVENDCWRAVSGTYKILLGFSAADVVAEASFRVINEFTWKGL